MKNKEIVEALNNDSSIIKVELENGIISYKFKNKVFFDKAWSNTNVKARGLFCRGDEVVARSYDKFFNVGEVKETFLRNIERNAKYPIEVFQKENGFLGIVSFDRLKNELFISSKSTNQGDFAILFQDIFFKQVNVDKVTEFLKENNVSLIFEVIEPKKDPHIIEYDNVEIILLDIVENSFDTKYFDFNSLVKVANDLELKCKKLSFIIDDVSNFKLIETLMESEHLKIEGYVFRCADNFQFKVKTKYYNFVKRCRTLKDRLLKNKQINLGDLTDNEKEFVNFLKDKRELLDLSIIKIFEKFKSKKN